MFQPEVVVDNARDLAVNVVQRQNNLAGDTKSFLVVLQRAWVGKRGLGAHDIDWSAEIQTQ